MRNPHLLQSDSLQYPQKLRNLVLCNFSQIHSQITENEVDTDKCSFLVSRNIKHVFAVWFGIRVFGLPFS